MGGLFQIIKSAGIHTLCLKEMGLIQIHLPFVSVGFVHSFSSLPEFRQAISASAKDCALSCSSYEPCSNAPPCGPVESPPYTHVTGLLLV